MKVYQIQQKQFLPISLQDAWNFFSTPRNLNAITPQHLNFQIISISDDRAIYPGQLIRYRIRILPFVRVTWLTEITAVAPGEYFVDDQRKGPYALWQHRHEFRQVPGGVEMTDEVKYSLPFSWLGQLVHRIFVHPKLKDIFSYRRRVLKKLFEDKHINENIRA